MKLHGLRHVGVRAWPPDWASARGLTLPESDSGILAGVRLLQDGSILVRMTHEGRDSYGLLIWDRPPSAAAVAGKLVAAIGRPVRELDDLDVE